ncbi:MAG: molybdopterin-guanine dinucleotide biosynthesis protein B [Burkholderiaceae bacterium]
MKVFGIAGYSGSGKTTLIEQLLPRLTGRGLSVSLVKHAHHDFDVDQPGKDSYRHRQAGASEVLVASSRRWALMHESRGEAEPALDALLARLSPCDLVLIEGFKREPIARLEVHRPSVGKPLLCATDPGIVALATDEPDAFAAMAAARGQALTVLDLDRPDDVVSFILMATGLAAPGA